MSFLEGYDRIPNENPAEKTLYFYKWLRTDWRTMFEEVRTKRPILKMPAFTLITRANDAQQVVSNDSSFGVDLYQPAMDTSIGPFMLARDHTVQNYHEKSVMRSVMSWDDLPRVADLVERTAAESLRCNDERVELVSRLGRRIPVRILKDHFGFDNATDEELLAWSRATQSDIFRNPSNNSEIRQANAEAGAQLQERALRLIADKLTDKARLVGSHKPIDRLIARLERPGYDMTLERAISNVCGLLVGAVETINQATIQIIQQILMRPDVKDAALGAALSNDMTRLRSIVWEALRFDPVTTFVLRLCKHDFRFDVGGEVIEIKAGEKVAACIGSAMFDPILFPDPSAFKLDRPERSYMHFGFGPHVCLGQYVAGTAIPYAVKHALLIPGISLIEGEAGQIDYGNMHFPEKFYVAKRRTKH